MFFEYRLLRYWRETVLVVLMLTGLNGCSDSATTATAQHGESPRNVPEGALQPNDAAIPSPTLDSQSASPVPNPAQADVAQVAQDHSAPAAAHSDAAVQVMPSPPVTVMEVDSGSVPPSASELADSDEPSPEVLNGGRSLGELLEEVVIPPPWLADVETTYDTTKPWDEARLEIRRLLGVGTPETHHEALKLTWTYFQNDNMGNGHEYPMYTFLGGEPLWSVLAHEQFLAKPHENTPIHAHLTLASLYAQFGAFAKAQATLDVAMQNLPAPPWQMMRRADVSVALGDLYVAWDKAEIAKGCSATLADGEYRDTALGYAGDIDMTLRIEGGQIADLQIRHEEKIDQNACVLIPQWIVEQQTLQVDGISGATVTRDAIINGAYRCLKQAGLK